MPLYAVFLHHPADQPEGESDEAALAEHDAHGAELSASGRLRFAAPLADPAETVSVRGGEVVAGPYTETSEVVVGFYVIEADDLDAAVAVARQNPINHQGGGVEVRPVAG
ncbi:YciI family protein [Aestuariimicrobium ganziense]|uniref:YciI family protein n=1 Tax=Aestuariimicrobium ganziense TaxID=2773677 RepID=UPI0019436F2C|nr:YciI family protein [Aestuariimicrobium ganziense]